MFTGIVEEVGRLQSITRAGAGGRVRISCSQGGVLHGIRTGDSIAVNGTCLTVTRLAGNAFFADVTPQTLGSTNLGGLAPGDKVNLERAVALGGRLGGHIVTGHVDYVSTIVNIREIDNSRVIAFALPAATTLGREIVPQGSVAVNGISLTVAAIDAAAQTFSVSVIPTTLVNTNLAFARAGATVNVETDIIGKYVASCLLGHASGEGGVRGEGEGGCGAGVGSGAAASVGAAAGADTATGANAAANAAETTRASGIFSPAANRAAPAAPTGRLSAAYLRECGF